MVVQTATKYSTGLYCAIIIIPISTYLKLIQYLTVMQAP